MYKKDVGILLFLKCLMFLPIIIMEKGIGVFYRQMVHIASKQKGSEQIRSKAYNKSPEGSII